MLLKGKTVLVAGASGGIGRAVSERYAAEGATLLLAALDDDKLAEAVEVCKAKGAPVVEAHPADFTDPKSLQGMIEKVLEKRPQGIDVLVNAAGIVHYGNCVVADNIQSERIIAINLNAPMRLIRGFAPAMKKNESGTIINFSSRAGQVAIGDLCAYSAAKFGLRGFSLSCHESLKEHNVRVMLICPELVATPMAEAYPVDLAKLIQASDIAEACMLPFKLTAGCVPAELSLANGKVSH